MFEETGLSKKLLAYLTLVPAIATAITGYLAFQVKAEVEKVNVQLAQLESQRAFDLKIYEAVKAALKGDAKDQQVALALVVSIGQEPLRSALLQTLEESPTSDPEIVAEARSYRVVEKEAARPAAAGDASPAGPAWRDWDFDLFYCETSPDRARVQAEKVHGALVDDGAMGRIRVRLLSAEKNRDAGYRKSGYTVYRSEDEAAMAEKLARFASATLRSEGVRFDAKPAGTRTPWYISAFFCPESGV